MRAFEGQLPLRSFKRVEGRLSPNRSVLLTTSDASRRMARVRQHGTYPEIVVRQAATRVGLKYRLSNRDLPGSPDLANRSRRWAIFVHGCFWHRHEGCKLATTPKKNRLFWTSKFRHNCERDKRVFNDLQRRGFKIVVIWQCETSYISRLNRRLRPLLGR